MEVFVFARFHAREGEENALEAALRDQLHSVRADASCLAVGTFRYTHDPRLFYLYSRWIDEAAFNSHAGLPHSMRFLERVRPLIDHPSDVSWTKSLC